VVRTFEAQLFDADTLLEMAFAEFADVDNVIKLRERKRPAIEKEFAEHKAKMRQRELAMLKSKVGPYGSAATDRVHCYCATGRALSVALAAVDRLL
jgi:hypothetical protein